MNYIKDAAIEWSEAATVLHRTGEWWSPFTHNSLAARVKFDDGYVVVVTLPDNARPGFKGHALAYAIAVYTAAADAKSNGDNLAEVFNV